MLSRGSKKEKKAKLRQVEFQRETERESDFCNNDDDDDGTFMLLETALHENTKSKGDKSHVNNIGIKSEVCSSASAEPFKIMYMPDPNSSAQNVPLEFEITAFDSIQDDQLVVESVVCDERSQERTSYRKRFLDKWLTLPEFEEWLEPSNSLGYARCKVCKKELLAGKSELLKHAATVKHKKKMRCTSPSVQGPTNQRIIDLRPKTRDTSFNMLDKIAESLSDKNIDPLKSQISQLENEVAAALNKEAGLYVYNCMLANLLAIQIHCPKWMSTAIVGKNSELAKHWNSYICLTTIDDLPYGTFNCQRLQREIKIAEKPCLVCIENSHLASGGQPLNSKWVDEVVKICSDSGVILHLDGSRLTNTAVAESATLSSLCVGFDTVTFGLDASLNGPSGCVLAGPADFIANARRKASLNYPICKSLGILASGCLDSLTQTVNVVMRDHENAKIIAKAVQEICSVCITAYPDNTHTNIVQLFCDGLEAEQLVTRLQEVPKEEVVALGERTIIRSATQTTTQHFNIVILDTHCDISDIHIKAATNKIIYVINELTNIYLKSLNSK